MSECEGDATSKRTPSPMKESNRFGCLGGVSEEVLGCLKTQTGKNEGKLTSTSCQDCVKLVPFKKKK